MENQEHNVPKKVRSYILSLLPENIWVIQRTFQVESKHFDKNLRLKEMELSLLGTQICVRNNTVIEQNSIQAHEVKLEINKPYRKKPRYL
ncbi:hypothetical protein [Tepidibacillus sp. HK-1]|uniref:hypothetical protein n=1 Tax=Tepidibacillus sp. HK-1 TaxID=1883407 RepID=UPI00085291DB|nr:hypothetical protein [Tepidibacillus sp. HK-1]GBF11861.1 hypothetical protein HK1_01900 [Tepidibacillus sp. HK-1]